MLQSPSGNRGRAAQFLAPGQHSSQLERIAVCHLRGQPATAGNNSGCCGIDEDRQTGIKMGSFRAFMSKEAVARQPKARWRAPMRQSAN